MDTDIGTGHMIILGVVMIAAIIGIFWNSNPKEK